MIPEFDDNGNLPPGIHFATLEEFVDRFGNTHHRQVLIGGLRRVMEMLKMAGCQTVYVDGSFITAKMVPDDYDACWDIDGVDSSLLDPIMLDFRDKRVAQKTKYFGEFFPVYSKGGDIGEKMLRFFQMDRNGNTKGIIAFNLRRMRL